MVSKLFTWEQIRNTARATITVLQAYPADPGDDYVDWWLHTIVFWQVYHSSASSKYTRLRTTLTLGERFFNLALMRATTKVFMTATTVSCTYDLFFGQDEKMNSTRILT